MQFSHRPDGHARSETNKQRLELLLDGGIPDHPPHWELVFQIQKDMFGIDPGAVLTANYSTDDEMDAAVLAHQIEVHHKLVDELGWAAVGAGYTPQRVNAYKEEFHAKALVAAYEGDGVFWMPTGSEMMNFAVKLHERPEDIHAEAREKRDRAIAYFRQAVDAGADFFVLTYDFGFNDAPFISPRHFREFVTPYLTEIVGAIHDLGRKAILHSDGCIAAILDQIHATGVDGYQSIDPQGGMDIEQVRRDFPDWLLMGNVPCNLLQDVDETKIREAVATCMKRGGLGKRYIFSTSNCIYEGMPPESYRIMLDEYHKIIDASKTR